jgi:UDP-hydrolysing UDP-N-acetyl-D-glucosamine 2-epimerase
MVKTTGLSLISLADEFYRTRPDIVVTVADRYETIATAIAASYMNIVVAHTQGGEVTGSIDDNVRHAITKLSHVHFPATKKSHETLVRLGEDPHNIFHIGCPAIDLAAEVEEMAIGKVMSRYHGVGAELDFTLPFLLVTQHPDTLEYEQSRQQITETLRAVRILGMQVVWLWPNVDSGSDGISKRMREFREENRDAKIRFYRNFSAEDYIRILKSCSVIIGNSSSGIREASYLGVPSVNIGDRQRGRERPKNVIDVTYERDAIVSAVKLQLDIGRYLSDHTYGNGKAGVEMARILAERSFSVRKKALSL